MGCVGFVLGTSPQYAAGGPEEEPESLETLCWGAHQGAFTFNGWEMLQWPVGRSQALTNRV